MSRKSGSIGEKRGTKYSTELKKLVEEYEALKAKVDKVYKSQSRITSEVKKYIARLDELEQILHSEGVLTGVSVSHSRKSLKVYFWLTKRGYKEARKKGLYPIPFITIPEEHKCFYSIMRSRGYDFPEDVLLGRLTSKPYMPLEVALSHVVVYAKVGIPYVWAGDADLLNMWSESTVQKLRLDYCKLFADSVVPISKVIHSKNEDVSSWVAMVSRHIRPHELIVTTEYMQYLKL